jgi:hypothetical protein
MLALRMPADDRPAVRDRSGRLAVSMIVVDGCAVSRWEALPGEVVQLREGGHIELTIEGVSPAVLAAVSLRAVSRVVEPVSADYGPPPPAKRRGTRRPQQEA